MPEISTVKNAVRTVVKKDRFLNALFVGAKSLVVSIAKIGYALWLEVTGLLFGVFAVTGGSALVRQYRADHFADHRRFLVVAGFTLVCAWFTLLSFLKARRLRR
jgi:hypothetical protein